MIFDRTELFSSAQAVTATTASTNVYDTGSTGTVYGGAAALRRDLGKGTPLPLAVRIVQGFNNLTSLQIAYQVADDAGFTVNATTVASSPAYALAQCQPGAVHIMPDTVPVGADRRYHRLFYTITGAAPTTGQITAGIVDALQTNSIL